MRSTTAITAIALLAMGLGSAAMANETRPPEAVQRVKIRAPGLQGIFNPAAPDQPGYGWRYYRDPAAYRAVVISPQGDYYFSDGEQLRWVAQAGSPRG